MAIDRKRQTVRVTGFSDVSFDDMTINEAVDYLKGIEDRVLRNHLNDTVVKVFFETEYWGYEGGHTLNLVVERLETDSEYNKRIAKLEKEAEKRKLAKELKKEQAKKVLLQTQADEKKLLKELIDKHGIPTD